MSPGDEKKDRKVCVQDEPDMVQTQSMPTAQRRSFDAKSFMPQRVNAEISRRYDIDAHEIGSGGYGKVFVAKDREVKDRMVAIKKVIIFDDEKKAAFMKEARIMKELDHPNICKLLETYEQGKFMFFVMEYCEGREVFDRIMDQGWIAESTTAEIVKQAASALKYAHTRGIAHRDMKPENICFCTNDVSNNHVKVIDWGLGFYFGQARMVSAVGSLTYAAPEVLEAKDSYSSACDLWSLGVVTYVMLCGKPPFWGNYADQLKRMKQETYPMKDQTWQQISSHAKAMIRGLLKADPKKRMPLDEILNHDWLRMSSVAMDKSVASQVLVNMRNFSNTSQFFSICVASVARQLDHRSLRDVHAVFCEMDTNGDGVLDVSEVKEGFEKIFGKNSPELADVEEVFARLDLDASGTLDYTEFCAAGIGERISTQEHVLWAAFKAFDIHDDDGKITKQEIEHVLQSADVNKVWTKEVCEEVSKEIFDKFDRDGDGELDFDEWLRLMRDCANRHSKDIPDQDIVAEVVDVVEHEHDLIRGLNVSYDILKGTVKPGENSGNLPNGGRRGGGSSACCADPATSGVSPPKAARQTSFQALRNNTPACFTCVSGDVPSNGRCSVM